METLCLRVATLSLTCSAVLLPLLLLAPRLRGRYAAKSFYVLWLVLSLRLIIPFQLVLPRAAVTVQAPSYEITLPSRPAAVQTGPAQGQEPSSGGELYSGVAGSSTEEKGREDLADPVTLSLTQVLAAVWLTGAGCFLAGQIGCYFLARRAFLRNGYQDWQAQRCLDELRGQLGMRTQVALCRTPEVDTPTMLGYWRPVILMPEEEMGKGRLELILRHELLHRKRGDVLYKSVLLLANALHWFNPLVWWMSREAGRNLELCCDRDLVQGESPAFCRQYGEVLLQAAAAHRAPAFSTQFGGGKAQLKERLINLFQKKRRGRACMAAILGTALLVSGLVACESQGESASYSNEVFHYTVELPKSWAGKFTATESQGGNLVEIAQKNHGENDGVFFWLTAWNEEQWDRLQENEDEALELYQVELDRRDGVVITYGFPTDVQMDVGSQEIMEEYQAMEKALQEAGGVKLTFTEGKMPQVADTGRQYTNELWGFTLTLPENWADQYVVQEFPEYWVFYHRDTYNEMAGLGGVILSLNMEPHESLYGTYGDDPAKNYPVPMIVLGEKGGVVFYIAFASDVQSSPNTEEVYTALYSSAQGLTTSSLQFLDDQLPTITAPGYLLEARSGREENPILFRSQADGSEERYPIREGLVPVFLRDQEGTALGQEISYSALRTSLEDYAGDLFRLYLKDGAVWYIEQMRSRVRPILAG